MSQEREREKEITYDISFLDCSISSTRHDREQSWFLAPRSICVCVCVCVCVFCVLCVLRSRSTVHWNKWSFAATRAWDRRYWPCETRGVARIASSPPPRCSALTTTRKAAVCHNSFRSRPRCSSEEGSPNAPARLAVHRCTLSTGNGAAFIELPSGSSPRNHPKKC